MSDEITLVVPAQEDFRPIVHLVIGGLAVRLDLTFEHLEDLEVALDALLERPLTEEALTVRVQVLEGELRTTVGPFAGERLRAELERGPDEGVSLRRILDTVVDAYELDKEGWLELVKRVGPEQAS